MKAMPVKGGKRMPATRFPKKSNNAAVGSKISKGVVKTAQTPTKPANFPAQNQKAYRKQSRVVVSKTGAK